LKDEKGPKYSALQKKAEDAQSGNRKTKKKKIKKLLRRETKMPSRSNVAGK